jgi:hypothetical protein
MSESVIHIPKERVQLSAPGSEGPPEPDIDSRAATKADASPEDLFA